MWRQCYHSNVTQWLVTRWTLQQTDVRGFNAFISMWEWPTFYSFIICFDDRNVPFYSSPTTTWHIHPLCIDGKSYLPNIEHSNIFLIQPKSNRNSLRVHNHTGHWSIQTERQTQQPWLNPCPFALLFLWLFHYGNGIFVHKTWTAVDTGGQHPTKSYLVQICFGPVTFTPIVQIAQMLTCWSRMCARLCVVHFPSISTDRFGTVNGNKMQSSSFGFCNTSWRHHNHRK